MTKRCLPIFLTERCLPILNDKKIFDTIFGYKKIFARLVQILVSSGAGVATWYFVPPPKQDIIEQVENSGGWNNALALPVGVRKSNGSCRPVLDLRAVNALTQPIISSLPRAQDCAWMSWVAAKFLQLLADCARYFFQMELHPDDKHCTAFYAPHWTIALAL